MKMVLVAVFDKKAESFNKPVCLPSLGVGERMMRQLVQDRDMLVGRYAEDYALYYLGTFDDESGEIAGVVPRMVMEATKAVKLNQEAGNVSE